MNWEEVMRRLQNIVLKNPRYSAASIEEIQLSAESSLVEDLYMDSLQILELIVDIEEEFDVMFDFEVLDAYKIRTLGGIVELIIDQLKGRMD